ncbi:MAG TPA: UvrD-helicase domain-containing protein [Acidimicrobiales bacterium]|nr:UvrD-helicase domain-containing protein [Acidimicrobiales bacterium]
MTTLTGGEPSLLAGEGQNRDGVAEATEVGTDAASVDARARERIATELDTSLVVVAGAGTGKTTELVGRVLEIVAAGAPLREVAAITFTEAAAAELRVRLRDALASRADATPGDPHLRAALGEVDEAAICTLHAFAQRLLVEHCVAVGLPPGFEVLDDVADVAAFEDRWAQFADALLDDARAEATLARAFVLGLQPRDLEAVALELHANWDRVDDGLLGAPGAGPGLAPVDAAPVLAALGRVVECAALCTDADDLLFRHVDGPLTKVHRRLQAAGGDEHALLQLLRAPRRYSCRNGNKENWQGQVTQVRARCDEAEVARMDVLDRARASVVEALLGHLVAFTLEAADQRRREGRVTFHDLLVLARRLLRHHPDAAEALRRRYRRILVDEFQDSDPIQVELAARLAAASAGEDDIGATRPGALFVVGDPKQAIYRFRRADIATFDHAVDRVGDRVELHTNFRSVPGILDYVNTVFAALFDGDTPGQAAHVELLPSRQPLPAAPAEEAGADRRPAPHQLAFDLWGGTGGNAGHGGGGGAPVPGPATQAAAAGPVPVVVLGERVDAPAAEVRRRAALDAACALGQVVAGGWTVADPADGALRRARWGDMAVLIPTRASLPPLSEALDELDIPYRLEGSALLWGSDEVRDVLAVLRAVDDPTDAVAVVGALRTPGLACGDDDLVSWHDAGGTWDPRAPAPDGLDGHPVARAVGVLESLRRTRWWSEPSAMVAAALEATHAFELALAHRRPRDRWHRLRWLQDQARRFDENNAGTLRAFLHWAAIQEAGDRRGGSVGPPDPDDDAVRIMTIHAAKGLEFPVVLVMGLERDGMGGHVAPRVVWDGGHQGLEVTFGHEIATPGYAQAGAREKELDALEQLRLLYVAMTRARDHLLLCVHHGSTRTGLSERSQGAQLVEIGETCPNLWRTMTMPAPPEVAPEPGAGAGAGGTRPDGVDRPASSGEWREELDRWARRRADALARLRRRPVVTATAVAETHDRRRPVPEHPRPHAAGARRPGSAAPGDPGRPDAADATWRAGDEPLLVGRAVHGTLAALDLATGTDATGTPAATLARQRARAVGVEGRAEEVAAMVERALASPVVRRAGTRRHHKEIYVGTATGTGGVFEGFVDLVVEEDGGLVVVDYKTDRVSGAARDEVAVSYRLQVAAYANALAVITGRPLTAGVLVFLADGEAFEDVMTGEALEAARAEARELAGALIDPGPASAIT